MHTQNCSDGGANSGEIAATLEWLRSNVVSVLLGHHKRQLWLISVLHSHILHTPSPNWFCYFKLSPNPHVSPIRPLVLSCESAVCEVKLIEAALWILYILAKWSDSQVSSALLNLFSSTIDSRSCSSVRCSICRSHDMLFFLCLMCWQMLALLVSATNDVYN